MVDSTRWTEERLGGWCLLLGTVAVAVGSALSPGRGMVDTVPTTSLSALALAMGRNEALAYALPVLILLGALAMLHGLVTLHRLAGPLGRLGLVGMIVGCVLQMIMRGFDYMIIGMGVAALDGEAPQSDEWLQSAVAMLRTVWGMHFTAIFVGFSGTAILALALALHPAPLRLPRTLNGIVAALAVAALVVFVAAWFSNELELALAPAFAAMSATSIIYMALLGWALKSTGRPPTS